jgi:putative transcriptional regulator
MTESPASVASGCLLVASPRLLDPNFARTVVLVISHGAEGSFGLVLNRPLGALLRDVLPDVAESAAEVPVHQGGPVQTDLVQFASRCPASAEALLPGVSVGVSLDELLECQAGGGAVRCYVGYAGWGAGQLEEETAEGSWIVAPARAEHVFDVPAERLWATVLRELGGQYAWMTLDGRCGDN